MLKNINKKRLIFLSWLNHFNQEIFGRTYFFCLLHANSGEFQILHLLIIAYATSLPYTILKYFMPNYVELRKAEGVLRELMVLDLFWVFFHTYSC